MTTEVSASVRGDPPEVDEVVDHRRAENSNIKCLAGIDPPFQDGKYLKFRDDPMARRTFKLPADLADNAPQRRAAKNFDLCGITQVSTPEGNNECQD